MLRRLSEESMKSIFTYILDWLFGNTDNPFSKEVRDMKDILVKLSFSMALAYKAN